MDQYFTPAELAEYIIGSLVCNDPRSAADFAAGEGSLLAAVRNRWPGTQLYATDVDKMSVRRLRRRFNKISAYTCNFLNPRHHSAGFLRLLRGRLSLIFLNPPFSCRGGTKFDVTVEGEQFTCGKALAFVTESLQYLGPEGILVALLPSSCMTSDRDKATLNAILGQFQLSEIAVPHKLGFSGCEVEVRCVCLQKRTHSRRVGGEIIQQFRREIIVSGVRLYRGRLSMPDVIKSKSPKQFN